MIRDVVETVYGNKPNSDGLLFWTYFICRVHSGRRKTEYTLFRVDNTEDTMEVLARECPKKICRQIIKEKEFPYKIKIIKYKRK